MLEFLGPVWGVLLEVLKAIWPFLAAGGSAVGALYLVNWLNKDPENQYKKYVPYVLMAVKYAERTIPSDTPNKHLAKADVALQEFLKIYTENEQKAPNEALVAWFKRAKELALLAVENSKKPTPPVA